MFYLVEIGIVLFITIAYYRSQRPQLKFLFLGYMFYSIALILSLPFRLLEHYANNWFEVALISQIIVGPLIIIISELTKYFSLKKFLPTKILRNAIFFAIGWVSLESVNDAKIYIISKFNEIFGFSFDASLVLNPEHGGFNFIYFFIVNIAITIFIIKAVISGKKKFILHAILYSLVVYFGLLLLEGVNKETFVITSFVVSIIIIFAYRAIS